MTKLSLQKEHHKNQLAKEDFKMHFSPRLICAEYTSMCMQMQD